MSRRPYTRERDALGRWIVTYVHGARYGDGRSYRWRATKTRGQYVYDRPLSPSRGEYEKWVVCQVTSSGWQVALDGVVVADWPNSLGDALWFVGETIREETDDEYAAKKETRKRERAERRAAREARASGRTTFDPGGTIASRPEPKWTVEGRPYVAADDPESASFEPRVEPETWTRVESGVYVHDATGIRIERHGRSWYAVGGYYTNHRWRTLREAKDRAVLSLSKREGGESDG